ncbi:MAG: tetratricopeptide repeat protein [bacterium]|nr:tetratricopeptide repeat protein [bacterium]
MNSAIETADRFSPGTVVAGRYRVVCRLGAGGMGQVYRADDLSLRQPVALKFLSPALDQDPVLRRRFLDEVRFARQVSHANVCRVYDVGESDGRLFLSMEHIAGEDLRTLLEKGPLPFEQALEVSVRICRGLAAIHERGLLHRDLKPANVMIDAGGQTRLTDFGMAAPAGSAARGATFGGTVAYMAPEQLLGEASTMRSDLYALGLVTYELFTGRRPYPNNALKELARRYWGDESVALPEPELELEKDLDPIVLRVVRWCLATEPRDRPASAEAVEAALLPDAGQEPGTFLKTLLVSDLAGGAIDEHRPRELLAEYGGWETGTAEGPVWLFERPWGAVCFALSWRQAPASGAGAARIGIHLGEVILRHQDTGPLRADGPEVDRVRRLAEMARPGQTLLSPHAFDLARHHSVGEAAPDGTVRWLSHGRYRLWGLEEATEVFEVGLDGAAPLLAPESSEQARAVPEGFLPGWRPAPRTAIPQRPGWQIERKLGEGGFGDIWLARDTRTRELRVFKFCYDLTRLRALQREITIFRLLKEQLGERLDITRVLDWNFDAAPYFIESEYTMGGSLAEWAEGQGGLDRVPLAVRLELVAQVATALSAAHSVGVLHKDVKPGNVLIAADENGEVKAQLSDFGIGVVTDRDRLAAAGITVLGLTETTWSGSSSSSSGTRLYMAPELLEGKPPTLQTDIYALGLMLYQMVVGDLSHALAPGWQRDVDDEILRDDIEATVDGSPSRRLGNALQLAERLRSLAGRRTAREAERRARRRAERARRQRRILAAALVVLAVFGLVVSRMAWRVAREAERAEREAQAARQVATFLVDMFEVTDPFGTAPVESRGGAVTARDLLDRGARRLETELGDQPEIRAQLMNTVGRVYGRLALYDSAEALFEEALALRRKSFGENHPDVAESLADLAWVVHLKGEQERAEALFREALALHRKSLGEEHPHVANDLGNLAWVLQARGDYDAAEKFAREALAMKRRLLGDRDRALAASLSHLAFLLQLKGDADAAEKFARDALAMTRRLLGEHPDVAENLNGLARVLLAKGDPAGAEPPAREALAMRRRLLGDEHPAIAQSLHDLACVLLAREDYEAAEALFHESLAMYRRLSGDKDPAVAMNLKSLVDLYDAWGRPERSAEYRARLESAGGSP